MKEDTDSLIHITRIYTPDIHMSFGLDKSDWMLSKRDKMIITDGQDSY